MLYVVCCLLFVVYRLKEKISLLDLDYSHRTMFMWGVPWAFFFSVPRPCFQHYFLGYKSLSELGCFRRRTFESIWSYGGPSKNSHIFERFTAKYDGVPRPLFLPRAFSQQRSGNWHHKRHRFAFRNFGIDCLVPWYEFVRSACHGLIPNTTGFG